MNGCLILSDAFSASNEMTIWFSFFSLLKSGEFHYVFNAVTTLWYGSLMCKASSDNHFAFLHFFSWGWS